ncbi:LysR substrate-binding domain-containing protein [Reyranella soli]|uniref:LysR family transcriptional regulator n=1 Tax=Reyranella soli TaxID=1230389 RepID=A0A512NGE4_9HYPH|nr:LysR substrate-binding domain-containing protein [Reyranella soli]GEP58011.1 LysR family transcriptional regulator [Reyranella soli]
MNLRSLRCFLAVAEELHFGRAAKRLNLSQPPLTQHIKALEAELSVTLFHRTKRSVRITDAGTALLDEARRLVGQVDGLRHVVQRADKGRSGYLRAGFITSSVFTETHKLYATMSRGVPGVTVMWQEMNSSEQIEALHEDKIDIAFLHTPAQHPGLTARVIVRDPMVMAVPDGHRLAGRKRAALSDFALDDFVLPLRHMSPIFYDSIIAACRAAGISPTIPPHQPRNLLTILSLVSVGAGVSVVPSTLAASGFPGVTFMRIKGEAPVAEVSALWKPDNRSPVLKRALSALRLAA